MPEQDARALLEAGKFEEVAADEHVTEDSSLESERFASGSDVDKVVGALDLPGRKSHDAADGEPHVETLRRHPLLGDAVK